MDVPRVSPDLCDGCGQCLSMCCADAISIEAGKATISADCIVCLACVNACPQGAISEPTQPPKRRPRLPFERRPVERLRPGPPAVLWPPRRS